MIWDVIHFSNLGRRTYPDFVVRLSGKKIKTFGNSSLPVIFVSITICQDCHQIKHKDFRIIRLILILSLVIPESSRIRLNEE